MKKYFIAASLLLHLKLLSQNAVTNNGNLQIHTNASISFFGDLTNTATGSLENNGSVHAKASVTNHQPSMSPGSGSLFLDGASLQYINGSQPVKVYNLTSSNSAGILLNNNLHVYGTHTFSSGLITSSASPNYLVYESGASYTGASDTRHVQGWVKKIGNSNFIFPTGNGTLLREIEIQNLSAASEFDANYGGPTPNVYNLQSPVIAVNPNEYWTLNQISGTAARVKLNWDNSKVSFPGYVTSDIRVAQYAGGVWTSTGGTATGNVAASGSVTSGLVSNFGKFVIASTSFPVPLHFLEIKAQRENSSARITWQTANEVAVDFYQVQRSIDGANYITVAGMPAKNTDFQSYGIVDLNAPSSKLFYRIKANDVDGSTRYSSTAILSAIQQNEKMELLMNPVHSVILMATHNVTPSVYSYRIINSAGQLCKQGSLECNGSSGFSIPVVLAAGSYTLLVSSSANRYQFKLIVQ